MQYDQLIPKIIEISRAAGDAILAVYQREDFGEALKSDHSPLTQADLASHRIIVDRLRALTHDIPVLSEESRYIDFAQRNKWQTYWLVDPLDGTKEFIARNDEFTTNIALIHQHKAVLGVIFVPVFNTLYFAARSLGAFKIDAQGQKEKISVRTVPQQNSQKHYTVVASRRHGLDKVQALCRQLGQFDLASRGSSLKMCLVAEGLADVYPRLAPTSEWDTAAAHIIVDEAGGQIVKTDFSELLYNMEDSLLNPHFLVLGDPEENWPALLTGLKPIEAE